MIPQTKARHHIRVHNATVLLGGDGHYWQGVPAPAHDAFVRFAKELQPDVIVNMGDVIDGARISRHARISWENQPTVAEEIATSQERLKEIEGASAAELAWVLGNHDARFETKIANSLPEYEKVKGVHLKDHFPAWTPCWSVLLGDASKGLLVKHRFRFGVHAARNNAVAAGMSIATGHTHRLVAVPVSDYSGIRWGIETGMLAHPAGPQFSAYTEDNPRDWVMGFVVAHFKKGRLLWPEIVHVDMEGGVTWRGGINAS